ncbi:hypothetical protein R1sor_018531 [Riccia sorocarpa]|uniref:DUF668 domain-containing protein n=1 Tax=Riccia sorocarpa TaxID=122646 RepID=A0ABD3IBM2_9MARC
MGQLCSKTHSAAEDSDEEGNRIWRQEKHHTEVDTPVSSFETRRAVHPQLEPPSNRADKEEKKEKKLSRLLSAKTKTATVGKKATSDLSSLGGFAALLQVTEVGSLIGRAGTAGFGKAVEALDTFGSSITNIGGGFASGVGSKGNKIEILSFEVANTIVKGANLKQSLSESELCFLKEEVLVSEGVQRLVSQDFQKLMRIAAADKREELRIFAREVVRFGNHCQDPQWHRLDRIFKMLGTEELHLPDQNREEIDAKLLNLMTLAQNTAELYHELHALDRFELDLRRKLQEEDPLTGPHRGETINMMRNDLRQQQKHVKQLKKKSLWSKSLEEVMEQLVDIVYYLYQEICNAFGTAAPISVKNEKASSKTKLTRPRLGEAGLALHYANIINQIDSLVARPNSIPPNTRDSLYQGLPPRIKASLRNRLQQASYKEELTPGDIRGEMEKTLDWLVTVAANTTRAHHGFGWVGEWANTGRIAGHTELTLLQTLHHADQDVVEEYILDLIVDLHYLISRTRSVLNARSPQNKSATRIADSQGTGRPHAGSLEIALPPSPPLDAYFQGHQGPASPPESFYDVENPKSPLSPSIAELSQEDREMLKEMECIPTKPRKQGWGLSKSQEFSSTRSKNEVNGRLSKSSSHSPSTSSTVFLPPVYTPPNRSRFPVPHFALDISCNTKLDIIDRLQELDSIERTSPLISSSNYRTPQCV